MKLIELTQKEFAMVSQWGIGKKGKGLQFYEALKDAVLSKNVKLDIVHPAKYKKSSGHSPQDLVQASPKNVRARQPNISGKTSPPWKYGIIHSKILISDQ